MPAPDSEEKPGKRPLKLQIILILIGVSPFFLMPVLRHLLKRDASGAWSLVLLASVVVPLLLLYAIAVVRDFWRRFKPRG